MYVIVMMSKFTDEIFGAVRNVSNEVCRFQDYATAERTAFEKNQNVKQDEFVWVVKQDDGIYFKVESGTYE